MAEHDEFSNIISVRDESAQMTILRCLDCNVVVGRYDSELITGAGTAALVKVLSKGGWHKCGMPRPSAVPMDESELGQPPKNVRVIRIRGG